jgi:hypothetical protein
MVKAIKSAADLLSNVFKLLHRYHEVPALLNAVPSLHAPLSLTVDPEREHH